MSGSGAFYTSNGNYPHGGTGYIYFGVNNNVSGQTYQTVTIPTTATGNLTFWFNCSSQEGITTAYDFLYVEVRNTSGALLQTVATYSNKTKPRLETTHKNRLALPLTEVRLFDCNSAARLTSRYPQLSALTMSP